MRKLAALSHCNTSAPLGLCSKGGVAESVQNYIRGNFSGDLVACLAQHNHDLTHSNLLGEDFKDGLVMCYKASMAGPGAHLSHILNVFQPKTQADHQALWTAFETTVRMYDKQVDENALSKLYPSQGGSKGEYVAAVEAYHRRFTAS